MIKYFLYKEDAYNHTYGESVMIDCICPDCGNIRKIKISQLKQNGFSCICGDGFSYPEKIFSNILNQLNLDYTYQLSKKDFIWCNTYRYDFYIPKYNIIIETHGNQHYDPVCNFNNDFENIHNNDINKRKLALKNNIETYIELDCRISNKNYIKESIYKSELINYFDFTNVNWEQADEFATSSLIKRVCEYYELHKDNMTKTSIGKKFNITLSTVSKYLKKGEKFGWCNIKEL